MNANDAARDKWNKACQHVGNEMAAHAEPFVASISLEVSVDEGRVVGTGTYVSLRGKPYLLTNEHVARFRLQGSLGHLLKKNEFTYRIIHPFQCLSWPTDAAIGRIDEEHFGQGDRRAVPTGRIAQTYRTAHHELLFIMGFPKKRSRMIALLGGLISGAIPYVTQEMPTPSGLDTRFFFAIHYPNDVRLLRCDDTRDYLPDPDGLSGSAVWDTSFVAKQGQGWQPDDARIVGLVYGWDQANHALRCVKIEPVRDFLVQALRNEAAYFRWLEAGRPAGSDRTDWSWAVEAIKDIG